MATTTVVLYENETKVDLLNNKAIAATIVELLLAWKMLRKGIPMVASEKGDEAIQGYN